MRTDFAAAGVLSLLLSVTQLFGSIGNAQPTTAPVSQGHDLPATRDLVREIQFLLLRLGLDAGPVDGLPRQRTNRAVRLFEELHGLTVAELKRGGKVPAEFVVRLRNEAARAMLGRTGEVAGGPENVSPAVAPPARAAEQLSAKTVTEAIAPAVPRPPPDPFTPCSYDPDDFHIGPNRYTPDTFLKEGFDGSATHAVAHLQDRLEESRQIAERVGITALNEVQRQARVLHYFECRLKIEQAAANKN
jgi:hypothetical protein